MDVTGVISYCILLILLCIIGYITHETTRTKGSIIKYHLLYFAFVVIVWVVCPLGMKQHLFNPFGIVVIGCLFPIYESLRAIATPDTQDDMDWLQYWCAQSILYFSASYFNDYNKDNETIRLLWYQFEFFFFIWLYLPVTDGATLIFDYITGPILEPLIRPVAQSMGSWYSKLAMTVVNASHLWVLWAFFIFLNKDIKRFVTIAIGTVYPFLASVVAVTTPAKDDDTFWLTYWSCYGILFMLMDWLETWLGFLPGFYSVIIFSTVYLMLPMFKGADKIFRNILVPLCGLKKMLILRDAQMVKLDLFRSIPVEQRSELRKMIADSFDERIPDDPMDDGAGWTSPYKRRSGFFRFSNTPADTAAAAAADNGETETETTPLV